MIIMKKLTSLLIGCSLALAGAALAQQPVEQESPSKGKRAPEKARTTEAQQPKGKPAKPETPAAKQPGAMKERGPTTERGATTEPGAEKRGKTPTSQESATTPKTNVSGQPTGAPTPGAKQQAEQRRKGMKGPAAATKTSATPAAPAAAAASAAPSVPAAGQQNAQANMGAKA